MTSAEVILSSIVIVLCFYIFWLLTKFKFKEIKQLKALKKAYITSLFYEFVGLECNDSVKREIMNKLSRLGFDDVLFVDNGSDIVCKVKLGDCIFKILLVESVWSNEIKLHYVDLK